MSFSLGKNYPHMQLMVQRAVLWRDTSEKKNTKRTVKKKLERKKENWFEAHQSPGSHADTGTNIEKTSSFHGYWSNHLVDCGEN